MERVREEIILDKFYYRSKPFILGMMGLAILLFAGFAAVDYYSINLHLKEVLYIRLAIATPLLLILTLILFFTHRLRYIKLILTLSVSVGAGAILFFISHLRPGETAYSTYYGGLILVILFAQVVFLPPSVSNKLTVAIIVGYILISIIKLDMLHADLGLFVASNAFIISGAIIGRYSSNSLVRYVLLDHQNNLKLNESNAKLRELSDLRQKFITMLSHDVRGPLAGVVSILELYGAGHISEVELKEYNRRLMMSARAAGQILESIIEWSKVQYQDRSSTDACIKLNALVNRIFEQYMHHAETKSILLVNKVPDEIQIETDENVLSLVLRNLVSNAIKFTRVGHIDVNFQSTKTEYQLTVSDTGMGMDENLVRDFNDYGLVSSKIGTESEPGFGLGLLVCRDFLHSIGGKLSVTSSAGQGTVFTITIPSKQPAKNDIAHRRRGT